MKKILFLFSTLLLITFNSSAQFINFGQNRPSIRWKQIHTKDFQIIYPDFFETKAQQAANIYASLYQHANTLQLRPKKVSIIMHADGGISNGLVSLVPRKSELYTLPPQDPTDAWLEHLCVHEFRHVVQMDKVNQGLTRRLSYLFGELFPIAVVGVYIPMWFMEGDAVCFETAVGHLGRGRSPEFLNEMKAQIVEKGLYEYSKAVLGSYKDFVPNRYTMGYFMTANSRIHYGSDIWAKALTRTGRRPFGINPFATSLKRTMTGKRDSLWASPEFRQLFQDPDSVRQTNTYRNAKRTLYRDNFSELRACWTREIQAHPHCFDTISTCNRYYTDYLYPTPTVSDKVIVYKKGLQETGAFVLLQGNNEKLLTRTGSLDDYKFAVSDHQIVWSEYYPHIRWEQGGKMGLSSYDVTSRKYKRHRTRNNRLAPFRIDEQWGCVEIDHANRASLVILDAGLQQELDRIPAAENELFIHPSYYNGKIVTVVQSPEGLYLESIDRITHRRERLTTNQFYELDNPIWADSTVFYRASYNGNNALYRLTTTGTENILNSHYGLRFPTFREDRQQLYFSFYTADGYKPGKISTDRLEYNVPDYQTYRIADSLKQQENWQLSLSADSVYPTRQYNKFTHLVNIHSWGPLNISLNDMDVDAGAVVYSQNKLSTLSFTAGYVLKSGYDHGAWIFNASYSGWWPILDIDLQNGKYDYNAFTTGTDLEADTLRSLYVYNKARLSSAELTLRLPLNLSVRHYQRSLMPYFKYKIEGIHGHKTDKVYTYYLEDNTIWLTPAIPQDYRIHQSSRYYQLFEYGAIFNNQTRMAAQEINPRWGQKFSFGYTHSPQEKMNLGNQWWADGRFYLPGFVKNHSLSVYGGFQHMSGKQRNYGNKIPYPRGITLHGYEISSIRTSYHLPLFFPDKGIGSLAYFKRIAAAVFYDFGTSKSLLQTSAYSSYGLELTTDTHFFNLTYPIHLGIRTGYETQTKKMFADFIFSIGLSI